MNYKIILYVVFTSLSVFGLSGINTNGLFKKGKYWEARILVMIVSFALGYLVTNFVWDFLNP